MDHASDAIFIVDVATMAFLDANKKAQEITGRSLEDIRNTCMDIDGRSCMMGIFHDISEIQMTQESLQLANRKLNLLADITRHDIRNKLTVIGGTSTCLGSVPRNRTMQCTSKRSSQRSR